MKKCTAPTWMNQHGIFAREAQSRLLRMAAFEHRAGIDINAMADVLIRFRPAAIPPAVPNAVSECRGNPGPTHMPRSVPREGSCKISSGIAAAGVIQSDHDQRRDSG